MVPENLSEPFVESVFHPSDFSPASEAAFAHALAIALVRQAELAILHAGERVTENWARFPAVRTTLERWGLLEPNSPRRAVYEQLAVAVTKIDAEGDPVKACLDYVRARDPDLVVLATQGRDGLAAWLRPSTASKIARRTAAMTLFVPERGSRMVSLEDGSITLRRILVPVDAVPSPQAALVRASRAAAALGDPPVTITLLHVGDSAPPLPDLPTGDAWRWQVERRDGDPAEQIAAASQDADLVVMATDGRDGLLDVFRGSVTERVVRAAACPVLAVPSS